MPLVRAELGGLLCAACAALVASCALFTDLGGLSGGDDAPDPAADAAADGGSVPIADAASEDMAPPTPAGCAARGQHTFCDDFDQGSLTDRWTAASAGDGTLTLDTAAFVSAPRSLLVKVPPGGVSKPPVVDKVFTVASLSRIECSFDLRRDKVDPQALLVVAIFELHGNDSSRLFAELKNAATGSKLYVEARQADGTTVDTFPDIPTFGKDVGQWGRVTFRVSLAEGKTTVLLDGADLYSASTPNVPGGAIRSAEVSFGLVQSTAPSSEWAVRFDDVTCDLSP